MQVCGAHRLLLDALVLCTELDSQVVCPFLLAPCSLSFDTMLALVSLFTRDLRLDGVNTFWRAKRRFKAERGELADHRKGTRRPSRLEKVQGRTEQQPRGSSLWLFCSSGDRCSSVLLFALKDEP